MYLKYSELEEKLASRMDAMFGIKDSFIEVNPGRVLVPPPYRELGQRILDLNVRPDDVWLIAFPRTGSTWTLEMVWCIMNNLDFETARSTFINFRSPVVELSALFARQTVGEVGDAIEADSVTMVESMPSPRCIRSHMPLPLLPKQMATVKPKIVYVARNPKDVCVSFYHHCMNLHNLHNCTFEEFCELFLEGRSPVGPYLDHVLGFWQLRDEPNVLFVKYEDMRKDHRAGISKIAKFLEKDLSEQQITSLIDHASFNKMRENPAVNMEPILEKMHGPRTEVKEEMKFIRKGQVGDWKNHMSEEMTRRFDKWMDEKLKGTGLSFDNA